MKQSILYLYTHVYRSNATHGCRTVQVLTMLRKAGYEVDLLTLPGGDPWPETCYTSLYYIPRIPGLANMAYYGYGVCRWLATTWMLLISIRLSLKRNYVAVHTADRSMRMGRFLAWLTRTALIVEWRQVACRRLELCWKRSRYRSLLNSVQLVICDQSFDLDQLRKMPFTNKLCWFPLLPQIDVVHEPYTLNPQRNQLDRTPFHVAVYVDTETNTPLCHCLDALYVLRQRNPQLVFHILGGNVKQSTICQQSLYGQPHEEAFIFIKNPTVEQRNAVLAIAEIIILPDSDEVSPPITLLNAMRAGRALLVHDAPAYRSLLTHTNAMLVQDYHGVFIEAFELLLAHPNLRTKFANATIATIESERTESLFEANFHTCYAYALER